MWREIIGDFCGGPKKKRLLFFAGSKKRRDELYHALLHVPNAFSTRAIVDCGTPAATALHAKLCSAQRCWVYTLAPDFAEGWWPFAQAYDELAGMAIETIIYDPVQHLAYYEGGHADRCYLTSA